MTSAHTKGPAAFAERLTTDPTGVASYTGSARDVEALALSHTALLKALIEFRGALLMRPSEIAAKFGPDFNPDDVLIEADKKARAAIAAAKGEV